MKKLLFIFALLSCLSAQAQFPSIDSLLKFTDKYIRNSAVEAFTNLRLNTVIHGLADFMGSGAPIDSVYALNDSTLRIKSGATTFDAVIRGVYDYRRKVDTMYAINDSTIGFTINNEIRNIIIRGAGGKVPLTRTITINGNTQDLSANRTWTLTKSDVGLGNVDNTSDINKPVSTAQQAALDDTAQDIRSAIAGIITTVSHDATLTGDGTSGNPLKVDTALMVTQSALRDSLNNITVLFGNAGTGEKMAFTRNDSLLIKSIKVVNGTVASNPDSSITITIPPTSLTSQQVAYGAGDNTITSEAAFNYSASTNKLHADSVDAKKVSTDTLVARGKSFAGAESYSIADTLVRNEDVSLVAGNGVTNLAIIGTKPSTSGYPQLYFRNSRGTLDAPVNVNNNDTAFSIKSEVRHVNGSFTTGFQLLSTIGAGNTQILQWRIGASESFRMIEGGKMGFGVTTPVARISMASATGSTTVSSTFSAYQKYVYLAGSNESPDLTLITHYNNTNKSNSGQLIFLKTFGTGTSPGALQQLDSIMAIRSGGYDGSAMIESAAIRTIVDSTVSTGSVPQSIAFYAGKTGFNEIMRLRSNGRVGIGTASPAFLFDVNGSLGIAKASTPLVTLPGPYNITVHDTTTGQIKRAKISDVVPPTVVQDSTQEYTATVNTNNATPTTIATIPISNLTHALVEATCVGILANGAASYSGKKYLSFLRDSGGTITSGGGGTAVADTYLGTGLTTATHDLTSSGGNILVQVTGEAATSISWKVRYKITQIFTSL